ncbi:MAG TPA: PIN domain-containing protein [Fimbriimonadaceae bacterium]|nr:PIN domain-containing protein [Fimbriimonadaceae bacterium]
MDLRGTFRRISERGAYGWIRLVILLLCGTVGGTLLGNAAPNIMTLLFRAFQLKEDTNAVQSPVSTTGLVVTGIFLGMFIGAFMLNSIAKVGDRWEKMPGGEKLNIFIGVFGGFIAALPFQFLFNSFGVETLYVPPLVLGLTLGFASLAIYALQSMEEILPWTHNTGKQRRRGIKILDTNVIIDGRIYDVAKAGFLEGQLYVPNFVLEELQHIADDHNGQRRQRGRRGLEVLRHMQAEFTLEVGIYDRYAPDPKEEVDSRIVRIAKVIGADIVTNDWNLNRVASLQDIKVLNLNDLALALKPNVLPTETLELAITREGNQPGQGVGYLDDGTMVVVENGKAYMGQTVIVVVTQVIQTERGKMIFGEISGDSPDSPPRKKRSGF